MKFEGVGHIENDRSRESLEQKGKRVRWEIQLALMKRAFEKLNPADGDVAIRNAEIKWIEVNSENYTEAFNMVVKSDPEILNKWDDDFEKDRYIGFFEEHLKAMEEEQDRDLAA